MKIKGTGKNEIAASVLCGLLLSFILLTTAVQAVCFWIPGWWRNEYAKYDTPSNVRGEMSLDDAVYVTEQMLEYCMGRLGSLDGVEAVIDGVSVPFFTDREKQHLADCRELFMSGVRARTISIIMVVGLIMAIYFSVRKRTELSGRDTRGEFSYVLARGYLFSLAAVAAAAVVLTVIGLINFTWLFTEFHHVFFDNDLWILYPEEDNLINIMQEDVFADAAVTIACIWAAASAALAAVSAVIVHRRRLQISQM